MPRQASSSFSSGPLLLLTRGCPLGPAPVLLPQVQLTRYNDEEYESLIRGSSGDWSREETDYLLEVRAYACGHASREASRPLCSIA